MDQQYFYQPTVTKNAAYYRERARNALKGSYWYAFLAAMLASLLGGVSTGNFSFNFNFGTNTEVGEEQANAFAVQIKDILVAVRSGDLSYIFDSYPWLAVFGVVFGVAVIFGIAFSLFVSAPVAVGYQRYNLNLMDGAGQTDIGVLFRYFKVGYGKTIGLRVLYGLISFACSIPMLLGALPLTYVSVKLGLHITLDQNPSDLVSVMGGEYSYPILFLLACLVFLVGCAVTIVLSFVVQYRYAMSFLILAEYPEISAIDALRNSANLMRGNKWRLFCLQISFIGWVLLATMCTCGIGVMFLTPYMSAATAAFYDDIANRAAARETEFPSLDPNDYIAD